MKPSFEQKAIQIFPELAESKFITRAQVNEVVKKSGVSYPTHIVNPQNNIKRGVFNFSLDFEVESVISAPAKQESDAELDTRILKTYANMELLVNSVANGITKSMVISGAAGVGKSFLIKKILEQNPNIMFTNVRGYVKPTGIFKLLWENRFENNVIVFDDCDSVMEDVVGLNLLKSALELTNSRKICWMSEKEFISEDGETIPKYFDYRGQIIFLSNIDFIDLINKGNKLAPHLAALESRTIYLDLKIRTNREKLMRIKQVVKESSILEDRGIYSDEEKELMSYLIDNVENLREVSLRTVEKLAALYLASHTKWKDLADSVMLR
jgi:hypothetical protein